jgi:hypothetical protein
MGQKLAVVVLLVTMAGVRRGAAEHSPTPTATPSSLSPVTDEIRVDEPETYSIWSTPTGPCTI